jgi:cystathionine gamma-synthase
MSVVFRERDKAVPFFDALQVSKGPNLGTNFTLACPFTILAHYDELDFVESCGVSRYLVRISVGMEEPEAIVERFRQALRAC